MATNITINDKKGITLLTITSDNPVTDCGNDGGGARRFTVAKPRDIYPPLSENPAHFKDCIAEINGLDFGGNGEDNEIVIIEQPEFVEILIR